MVAVRRIAGGIRRALATAGALGFAALGVLLLVFPRAMGIVFAVVSFIIAAGFSLYALERRRYRDRDDGF
jgi:hypothetical protein